MRAVTNTVHVVTASYTMLTTARSSLLQQCHKPHAHRGHIQQHTHSLHLTRVRRVEAVLLVLETEAPLQEADPNDERGEDDETGRDFL